MSRRTSEANKAIAQAWEQEKQRVSEGNGTRDWTPNQQKDILERGKAYDDNGKAFEGQHMRSAEMHPECQGNPNNIQFLTREEHFAAHEGNWKNPTNWYYNPVTKTKTDFGDGPIIPCKKFELSDPVCLSEIPEADEEPTEEKIEATKEEPVQKPMEDKKTKQTTTHSGDRAPKISHSEPIKIASGGGIFNTLKKSVKTVGSFLWRHKGEIITLVTISRAALKDYADSNGSGSGNGNASKYSGGGYNSSDDYDYSDSYEDTDSSDSTSSDECSKDIERDYPSERSSPRGHDVSGYTRHQNGKEVHVNPYKRGGKKEDD